MKTLLISIILTLFTTQLAYSQGMGGTGFVLPDFAKIDTDENGTLSQEEVFAILRANAPKEEIFKRWDTDSNGSIDQAEFLVLLETE